MGEYLNEKLQLETVQIFTKKLIKNIEEAKENSQEIYYITQITTGILLIERNSDLLSEEIREQVKELKQLGLKEDALQLLEKVEKELGKYGVNE